MLRAKANHRAYALGSPRGRSPVRGGHASELCTVRACPLRLRERCEGSDTPGCCLFSLGLIDSIGARYLRLGWVHSAADVGLAREGTAKGRCRTRAAMMMMAKGGGRSKGLVRGVACPDLGCSRAQVSLCCTYATSRGSRGRAPGFSWGKESRERGGLGKQIF